MCDRSIRFFLYLIFSDSSTGLDAPERKFGRKKCGQDPTQIDRFHSVPPVRTERRLTDVLGLVERFRYVSGEHCVHGTHDNQHDRVAECYHVRRVDERRADQNVRFVARVVVCGFRRADNHPHPVDDHLKRKRSVVIVPVPVLRTYKLDLVK